jgi:predicted phage-related endonuclease
MTGLTELQIENRKRGVGCSEILAALGKDSRTSRLELYMRKIGDLPGPDFSENERVECGTYMEPAIKTLFERKLGKSIIKYPDTLFHSDAPLVGHPDGIVQDDDEPGIEFKNRDWMIFRDEYGEDGTDQVPIRDLVQCTGYMLITGKRRWLLGALVGGNERHIFEIPFDEGLGGAIIAGVTEFWDHVTRMTPPEPTTPEEVKLRWPRDLGTSIVATDEILADCLELAEAKAALKEAEQIESAPKTRIQRFMAEHAVLENPESGKPLATWKTARDSEKFDTKRFAEEYPDLYRQYLFTAPGSRRFLLK